MARLIVKASTGAAAPEATPIAHGDSCSMAAADFKRRGDEFMVSWSSQGGASVVSLLGRSVQSAQRVDVHHQATRLRRLTSFMI